MAKKQVGRPTKFTDDVVRKIEEVAALDGSVEEMAYYADLNPDTIYHWLKTKPEFSERIRKLRQKPILAARQTAVKGATKNYSNAIDYLKRKKKTEFGDHSSVEVTLPKPLLGGQSHGDNYNSDEETPEARQED
jgi:hypothetical protein